MFLGLRTVQYHVTDVRAARDWYAKIVGCQPYFDEPYYVGFNVGGFELGLVPGAEAQAVVGSTDSYWGVANIEDAYRALIRNGARPLHPVEDVGHGIRKATVLDPFGNALGIIENPHFRAS
jgi:predicted enzyme related to lactoylglutathione lyase